MKVGIVGASAVRAEVKLLTADDVAALLYGKEAKYLGVEVKPLPPSEGGLGV